MMSENRVTLEGNQAVIIDNGSGVSKVGLSGENTPRSCFTSVVGRHLYDFMI
jgi:actin-related protein